MRLIEIAESVPVYKGDPIYDERFITRRLHDNILARLQQDYPDAVLTKIGPLDDGGVIAFIEPDEGFIFHKEYVEANK
jgi:hypothetical protein